MVDPVPPKSRSTPELQQAIAFDELELLSTRRTRDGRILPAPINIAPWRRPKPPQDSGASMMGIPMIASGPQRKFPVCELTMLERRVRDEDVEVFDSKFPVCVSLMMERPPVRRWHFAVDLRVLECASPRLVISIRFWMEKIGRLVDRAYVYGLRPSSEFGFALLAGLLDARWDLIEEPDENSIQESDPDRASWINGGLQRASCPKPHAAIPNRSGCQADHPLAHDPT